MAKSKEPTKELEKPPKGKAQPIEKKKVSKAQSPIKTPKKSKAAPKQVEKEAIKLPAPEWCPAEMWDLLECRQQRFVLEWMKDCNQTKAYIRAGYSEESADTAAARLSVNVRVKQVLALAAKQVKQWSLMSAEAVLEHFTLAATADRNELVQYRRTPCRHCHGDDGKYQYTPQQWAHERDKWEAKRNEKLEDGKKDPGEWRHLDREGDWYDRRKPVNHDCNECHGEGSGEVFFADSRFLSEAGKSIYEGAHEGKDGIKVLVMSREKALDSLARHHKLFTDVQEHKFGEFDPRAAAEGFMDTMAKARELMAQVRRERGLDGGNS